MKSTNRVRKPKLGRKIVNSSRIVRVHHNRTNLILSRVSDSLNCPYQVAADEYFELVADLLNLSTPALIEMIELRILEKYT